jgi:hypothetical protein
MARVLMRRLARWHIWLGWLAGVPLVLWTLSGLVMASRPIDEVRGEHLRRPLPVAALPAGTAITVRIPERRDRQVLSATTKVEDGRIVTRLIYADERVERFDATGRRLAPVDEAEARRLVARQVVGGEQVAGVRLTRADAPPIDLRRPIAAWQLTLGDGTRVYVGRDSGEIVAIRTRWWRLFDVMWGLHIMDLQTREDTSHPLLIGFAALALVTTLFGLTLLFRRRRAPRRGALR